MKLENSFWKDESEWGVCCEELKDFLFGFSCLISEYLTFLKDTKLRFWILCFSGALPKSIPSWKKSWSNRSWLKSLILSSFSLELRGHALGLENDRLFRWFITLSKLWTLLGRFGLIWFFGVLASFMLARGFWMTFTWVALCLTESSDSSSKKLSCSASGISSSWGRMLILPIRLSEYLESVREWGASPFLFFMDEFNSSWSLLSDEFWENRFSSSSSGISGHDLKNASRGCSILELKIHTWSTFKPTAGVHDYLQVFLEYDQVGRQQTIKVIFADSLRVFLYFY